MSDNNIKVKVIARPEPNLRKLARALIALAEQSLEAETANKAKVEVETRRSA